MRRDAAKPPVKLALNRMTTNDSQSSPNSVPVRKVRKAVLPAAGFGTRFYLTKYISGNVMWTQVLTKKIAAESLIHAGTKPRVFFSVVAAFD